MFNSSDSSVGLFAGTLVAVSLVTFFIGFKVGDEARQSTIVKECAEWSIYTDRQLIMTCSVNKPDTK